MRLPSAMQNMWAKGFKKSPQDTRSWLPCAVPTGSVTGKQHNAARKRHSAADGKKNCGGNDRLERSTKAGLTVVGDDLHLAVLVDTHTGVGGACAAAEWPVRGSLSKPGARAQEQPLQPPLLKRHTHAALASVPMCPCSHEAFWKHQLLPGALSTPLILERSSQ